MFRKSLRAKILLGYMSIVLVLLLVSLWAIYNITALNNAVRAITIDSYRSLLAVQNMLGSLEQQNRIQLQFLTGNAKQDEEQFWEENRNFLTGLSSAENNITFPGEKETLAKIGSGYDAFANRIMKMYTKASNGEREKALRTYKNEVEPLYRRLKKDLYHLYSINQDHMVKTTNKAKVLSPKAITSTSMVSILGFIFALFLGYKISDLIIKPTRLLTETTKKIASGKLDQLIEIDSEDEIGQLAKEFNQMTLRLREFETANINRYVLERKKADAIIFSISDPIIVLDKHFHFVRVNPATERFFNIKADDVMNRHILEVIDNKVIFESAKQCLDSQCTLAFAGTERLVKIERGEDKYYFTVEATPFRDLEEQILGVVILLSDVTYFKEVDRLKSNFVSTASHEFRTPLTSMVMGVELLLEERIGKLGDKQREILEVFREDCDRLQNLVSQLLNLSRIEAGKLTLEKRMISISELFENSSRSLLPLYNEKHLKLTVSDTYGMPEVFVDPEKMALVINNLLSNALRYTDTKGEVTLSASPEEGKVEISVTDTGVGIPKEAQKRIFERFYQIDSVGDYPSGAAGLGLALVKEIVSAHGGEVNVESEQGKGSRFAFTIPIPDESGNTGR